MPRVFDGELELPNSRTATTLEFGPLQIPVKIHNLHREQLTAFHESHTGCGGDCGRKRYCKTCGTDVATEQVTKVYQLGDQKIPFTAEELDALDAQGGIKPIGALPNEAPHPLFVRDTYAIMPAPIPKKDAAKMAKLGITEAKTQKRYALLRHALSNGKMLAATAVVGNNERPAIIRREGDALLLYILWFAAETVPMRNIPTPTVVLTDEEKQTSEALIESLSTPLAAVDNQKAKRLEGMVLAKINGQPVETTRVETVEAEDDLMLLKQAIQAKKEKK